MDNAIGGTRYVPAPDQPRPWWETTTSDILGVHLHDNEEVNWTWFNGRVIGYTITIKGQTTKSAKSAEQ